MLQNYVEESLEKFEQKKHACLSYIGKVDQAMQEYTSVFGKKSNNVVDDKYQVTFTVEDVKKRIENSKMKILIAGQFKTGKSTMINAMLGQKVLPARVTPCTAVITEIEYAQQQSADLTFKPNIDINKLPHNLDPEVQQRIRRYNGQDVPALQIPYPGDVENFKKNLTRYLAIPKDEEQSQAEAVAETPYSICHLMWPLTICQKGAVIIDSPGLNEAKARDQTTIEYVPEADVIIYVLNALQCYSQTDKDFIESIIQKNEKLPILFLVNRFDQIEEDDGQEDLKNLVYNKLQKFSPYGKEAIFFISAQQALKGRMNGHNNEVIESHLPDFEKKMAEILNNDRCKIKLSSIQFVCYLVNNMSTNRLPALRMQLDSNVAELEQKFAASQKEFDKLDQKKKDISDKIDLEILNFHAELKVKINQFFTDFTTNTLDDLVNTVKISSISAFFGRKKDQERAVAELTDAVKDAMDLAFVAWSKNIGQKIFDNYIKSIKESIDWDMRQFSDFLSQLRSDLNMQISGVESVNMDNVIDNALSGAAVGGSISGGALFLASRFLPTLFSGPLGWAFVIASTLIAGILAAVNTQKDEQKLRNNFSNAAKIEIHKRMNDWSGSLAEDATTRFQSAMTPVNQALQQQIDNIKRPIEDAIHTLKKNHGDIETQKQKADELCKIFETLNQEGQELIAHL